MRAKGLSMNTTKSPPGFVTLQIGTSPQLLPSAMASCTSAGLRGSCVAAAGVSTDNSGITSECHIRIHPQRRVLASARVMFATHSNLSTRRDAERRRLASVDVREPVLTSERADVQ